MADYDYGQLIDDFELGVDVMPDEDLTAYIERRRREFESKADGGSIGIEVLFGPKREDFNIGGNVQRATTPQPYDSRATVADFARAIDRVGAGTNLQKSMDVQRYGESVRRQNIMDKFVNQPSFLGPATQQAAKNLNQGVLASQSALDMLNKTMTPFEPTLEPDRILEIVEQQRAAGVPETGLITNFKPNMADVAGPSTATTATTNTTGLTKQNPLNQLQLSGAVTLDESLDYAKKRGDPQSYLDFITREYDLMQQTPIDYLVREEKYKDASKSNITDELTRIYNQTSPQYRSADTLDKYISDYYKTNPYYADGGRVPAVSGGFLKLLAEGASKGKKGIMELVESGKGRFDEFVETMNQSKKPSELIDSVDIPQYLIKSDEPMTLAKMNLDRKTIDTIENTYKLGLYDEMPEVIKAKNLLERFTKPVGSVGLGTSDRVIDYKRAEDILNVKLNGDETIDDLFEIEFRTRPDKIPDQGLADGGRVGLFMGGDPLTGQALSIYESMNAYGFDDQAIANALTEQGLYTAPGSTPDTPDTTPGQTIGFQGGNDGPIGGAPSSLVSDFKTQTQNRQDRLTNPNKVTEFFNKFTGGGQADIGEMIRTGQIDTRKTSGIPLGVGAAFAKMMPDKYYDMSLGDQVFTQSQMGYTGPTVFGENTSGLNKDPFGLNTRSAFGNYAEAVGSDFASLSESLTGRLADKYGVEFDEETGMFVGANAKLANQMTNMMRTKFNFRKDQLAAKNRLDAQIKAAEAERQKQIELQKKIEAEAAAGKSLSQIGRENFTGEGMAFQAGNTDQGGGVTKGKVQKSSSVPGGYYGSPRKDGGLMFAKGGLATMFTRRR
jgi:hypothetical protein